MQSRQCGDVGSEITTESGGIKPGYLRFGLADPVGLTPARLTGCLHPDAPVLRRVAQQLLFVSPVVGAVRLVCLQPAVEHWQMAVRHFGAAERLQCTVGWCDLHRILLIVRHITRRPLAIR